MGKEPEILQGVDLLPKVKRKKIGQPQTLIPVQEAAVLQGVLSGKRIHEAVQEAGYGFNKANAIAFGQHLIKKHTDVNGELTACLQDVGIDLRFIAEKVKEGLGATKQMPVRKKKIKTATAEEEVIEYAEFADHHARHKHLETVLDILPGARAPKKVEVTQQTFEQKAVIVQDLRDNPQAAMAVIQNLIEQKRTVAEAQ